MRPRVDDNGDTPSVSKRDTERMRRKQKAQEMQKRLLQDFANKQRKFLGMRPADDRLAGLCKD